ncbi:MAG: histidine--tRNA ligase [Chloroflexi bacterium]|nr:histidine--tRNA ligase [Chloroflexota bacterium]
MLQTPRGTTDVLPSDQAYWSYVTAHFKSICNSYGYGEIRTPVFEDTRLFQRTVGEGTDIVEKEMYTFSDRGGDSLTLRPEGTAPVVRAYLEHGMHRLPQPVKLSYIASIFRYDRPQAGRLRQHHQFGVEALGEESAAIDAEVISLLLSLYRSVGLTEVSLQLNSIGDAACRPQYIADLAAYYRSHVHALCENCQTRLERNPLRLLDCKEDSCQPFIAEAPHTLDSLCTDCDTHFGALKRSLEAMKISYTLNHTLVRGLDYYTRTVFEVWPEMVGRQSALGGGGRYDGLARQIGKRDLPGIGFGTGIERIILNLQRQGIAPTDEKQFSVYVATLGEQAGTYGTGLVDDLRQRGIRALTSYKPRSLKAQLRQAGNFQAEYAVIVGDDELAEGQILLRDLGASSQENIAAPDVVATLERLRANGNSS